MTLPDVSSHSVGAAKLENEKRTIFFLHIQTQQGGKCLHETAVLKADDDPASIEPSASERCL